ncbi:DNA polymerase III subunit beta [Trueperella sp. LYQ143]|uniref:DNA polymerase III subunit beta n=1 Tax=Trueperella sp. LYQ143 TaxID=3391059 RepID=UPI0039839541
MKLSVDHDVFADAVTWNARTIPNRPAIPVLAGMRFVAEEDGRISLGSRDSDVTSHITFDGDVQDPGDILVNGKLLAEIARALPNNKVNLTVDGGKLEIKAGSAQFSIKTMAREDYSELPQMPPVIGTVDGAEWERAVSQVSIAASHDATLPLLLSICIEIDGDTISLMATDRFRLTLRTITWEPKESDISARILVPAARLLDVAKSYASSGRLELSLDQEGGTAMLGISAAGRQNMIQLIDGEYPQVRALFPEEVNGNVVMNRTEFLDAIKRARLVVEKDAAVKCSLSESSVTVEAGHGDKAQASETMEAQLEGEDITIFFSPEYLQAGFAVIEEENVRISFTTASKPVIMVGQDNDGKVNDSFKLLLMPIRTFVS